MTSNVKPTPVQVIVTVTIALMSLEGLTFLCAFALWHIYIDPMLLMVISNLIVAAASSLTTLLVGRTVQQLNQNSDVKNSPQNQEAATE